MGTRRKKIHVRESVLGQARSGRGRGEQAEVGKQGLGDHSGCQRKLQLLFADDYRSRDEVLTSHACDAELLVILRSAGIAMPKDSSSAPPPTSSFTAADSLIADLLSMR